MTAATPLTGSLHGFTVAELGRYTAEGLAGATNPIPADADHFLFYVGRDDVHGVLREILSRVTVSEVGNQFGYDDEELNDLVWRSVINPNVATFWTLDSSQAGSVHEKKILQSDVAKDPAAFAAHFAIIRSQTGQISHTKGFVADGLVGVEGSTNWSASGEGTFVVAGKPGGAGYKAQNNTVMVFTDRLSVIRFQAELQHEHAVAHTRGGQLLAAAA